jgi:hypothetical protein
MNAFEKLLLAFGEAAIVSAPAAVPIFVHSGNAAAIFNVSAEFLTAFIQMAQTTQAKSAPAAAAAAQPAN